jgi:hypothetical protein
MKKYLPLCLTLLLLLPIGWGCAKKPPRPSTMERIAGKWTFSRTTETAIDAFKFPVTIRSAGEGSFSKDGTLSIDVKSWYYKKEQAPGSTISEAPPAVAYEESSAAGTFVISGEMTIAMDMVWKNTAQACDEKGNPLKKSLKSEERERTPYRIVTLTDNEMVLSNSEAKVRPEVIRLKRISGISQ